MTDGENKSVAQLIGVVSSLREDMVNQATLLLDVQKKIDLLLAAFPEGGLMGHRLFHEGQQKSDSDSRAFRQSLRTGIAMFGIPVLLTFVGYAIWEYLKVKVRS